MRALLSVLLALGAASLLAQMAIVSRSSYVRAEPDADAAQCYHAEEGDTLVLADTDDHDGYYHVRAPGNCTGYVYRNRVRLRQVEPPVWARNTTPEPAVNNGTTSGVPRVLNACSFNIKFIGQGNKKQYQAITDLLKDYDLVLVQELVSAPMDMVYPTYMLAGTAQARTFFSLMEDHHFAYALSSAKTGPSTNTTNGSTSEYFVAFYKPDVLRYDRASSGFVDQPLVANPTFDRVPWTFHFTAQDGSLDFSVTDVHLAADEGADEQRKGELQAIADHLANEAEHDQLILGDMNIQDCDELREALPQGYLSLNAGCVATNVGNTGKPFDHVLYRPQASANDIDADHFVALDLVALMRPTWDNTDEPYPGDGNFNVATYGAYYSDHKPVEFHLIRGVRDDD